MQLEVLSTPLFKRFLSTLDVFASTDEARPILTCATVTVDGAGHVEAWATDSYAMVCLRPTSPLFRLDEGRTARVMFPVRRMLQDVKFLASKAGDWIVFVDVPQVDGEGRTIVIEGGGQTLSRRVGPFGSPPNMKKLMDDTKPGQLALDVDYAYSDLNFQRLHRAAVAMNGTGAVGATLIGRSIPDPLRPHRYKIVGLELEADVLLMPVMTP